MPIIGIYASAISGNLGLSVDYLVVAGGGGGGSQRGAGGGAGGYRYLTAQSLNLNTLYTVTVGAGGAGGTASGGNATSKGASGSDSLFGSTTSSGGGGGASYGTSYKNGVNKIFINGLLIICNFLATISKSVSLSLIEVFLIHNVL